MNLQELNAFAVAGKVDELNLISLDGVSYLIEARIHGAAHPLSDSHGQVMQVRSVEHAREVLHAFPELMMNLIQAPGDDEMCGMADSAEESRRVTIAFKSPR
jgi:hypothetical protein